MVIIAITTSVQRSRRVDVVSYVAPNAHRDCTAYNIVLLHKSHDGTPPLHCLHVPRDPGRRGIPRHLLERNAIRADETIAGAK